MISTRKVIKAEHLKNCINGENSGWYQGNTIARIYNEKKMHK